MILKSNWVKQAACVSNPGQGDHDGEEKIPVALKRLNDFIKNNCYFCPVAQECLDSSSDDDREWTVRGGYLPAGQALVGRGRPPGKTVEWSPKPAPEGAAPWSGRDLTLLEVGYCKTALHGIESSEDTLKNCKSNVCRQCNRDANNALAARNRKEVPPGEGAMHSRPYIPMLLRTGKCSVGHEIKSASDLTFYLHHGQDRSRCKKCASLARQSRTSSRTHCRKGHEFTKWNVVTITESTGKVKRYCLRCDPNSARMAS